ncbi:hypothetical protein FRC10_007627 [Ceratobasidium sp. 414]|nr:hypothetical protein FRC10_007627 [Ceratobasidium sp. 414]
MSVLVGTIVAALLCTRGAGAVGAAFGYATGTTGGGSAAAAVPTSTSQLASWERSPAPFARLGAAPPTLKWPSMCMGLQILTAMKNNYCSSAVPTAPKSTATYNKADLIGITVGSNKTLLGKGSSGGIKGKGLLIRNAKNVIIQNIYITDINPRFVWGGDAIQVDGSSNVWSRDMRYILVSYSATSYIFPSQTPTIFSTGCDGHHYWVFLFVGSSDTITLARNYYGSIFMTSGRGPHIGGSTSASQTLHAYNNYYVSITGHALDAGAGSKTLSEGNYFNTVTTPVTSDTVGAAYAPITSTQAASFSTYLGRNCYTNSLRFP